MTTPKEERARRRAEQAAKQRKRRELAGGELASREAPVDAKALAPNNSYGVPEFVKRGCYVDQRFTCVDCGVEEVWTAAQQKWWYEVAKGQVDTRANRCGDCRAKERLRRDEARRVHFEGILRKYGSLDRVLPRPKALPATPDGTSQPTPSADASTAPRGKGNARRRRKLGRKPPPDWKPEPPLD